MRVLTMTEPTNTPATAAAVEAYLMTRPSGTRWAVVNISPEERAMYRADGVQIEPLIVAAAVPAAQPAEKPFLFAIMGPDGKPHMGEYCVSTARGDLEDEIEGLNADSEDEVFKEVALCLAPEAGQLSGISGELDAAARDVLAERRRQIETEGWTFEHDDTHVNGEMAKAAAAYALNAGNVATGWPRDPQRAFVEPPEFWPWDRSWWKPDTLRWMLVKSAALTLAEIERYDRAAIAAMGKVA